MVQGECVVSEGGEEGECSLEFLRRSGWCPGDIEIVKHCCITIVGYYIKTCPQVDGRREEEERKRRRRRSRRCSK